MFKLEDVYAGYVAPVVHGVNIDVRAGEVHAILGPNGSGKSTLLRCATGVLPPLRGRVLVDNMDLHKHVEARKYIGYLPEGEKIFRDITAEKFLRFMCKFFDVSNSSDRISYVSDLLDIKHLLNKRIAALSMGQKRKVALAGALVHDSSVLILDEPTANLDVVSAKELREYIRGIAKSGKAILMSSHNMREVEELATHVTVLIEGKIVLQGVLDDIMSRLPRVVTVRVRCEPDPEPFLGRYTYFKRGNYYLVTIEDPEKEVPRLVELLQRSGVKVLEVGRAGSPLEELLITYAGGERK